MRKLKIFSLVILLSAFVVQSAWASSALKRIQKKGELVVGMTGEQPPLNVKTKKGNMIGMDVDISRMMASSLGVKSTIKEMSLTELIPALQKGEIDVILSGMTITPERNIEVAFVGPYYVSGKGMLTKAQNITNLTNPNYIKQVGVSLVALKGSTSEEFVKNVIKDAKLTVKDNYEEAVAMVINDEVEAMIADYPACAVQAYRNKDSGLIAAPSPFTYEPIGIAVSAEDPHFMNWMDNFLSKLKGSGNLKKITARWFEDDSWVQAIP